MSSAETPVYLVTWNGPFGFLKPWTAVRDELIHSQTFLTPSVIEGMRQKLDAERILAHRIAYAGMDVQQEMTQPRELQFESDGRRKRPYSILNRGVLIDPVLTLAFASEQEAQRACREHLCLCRNEDVLLPLPGIESETLEGFRSDRHPGFELIFEESEESFLVGFNRFADFAPQYGRIEIFGDPIGRGQPW